METSVVFPGTNTSQIVVFPESDPFVLTYTTSSTATAEGTHDFVFGLDVAFPKHLHWLTGAQISMFFRLQIDYNQPIVNPPEYLVDFSSCMNHVNFIPFSVSSTTKRIIYCFAVVGIAKPITNVLETVKVTFDWVWSPQTVKNLDSFQQTVSMNFWANGTAPQVKRVENFSPDILLPGWLFGQEPLQYRGSFTEEVGQPADFVIL